MFTLDAAIEAVQTSNKTIVNTFVQNEEIKKNLVKMIDDQGEQTRKVLKAATDFGATVTAEVTKAVQNAAKVDFQKFNEQFANFYSFAKK